MDQRRIVLHQTKNGEMRNIPLVGHALDALKTLGKVRRIDTPMVFPGKTPGKPLIIEDDWQKALKAAGIDNFRFHDLRHCTASYLAMNGATLPEIAGVLGHKSLQMVGRYAHLSEAHTAGVVERMNAKIFG
jgi:integrase